MLPALLGTAAGTAAVTIGRGAASALGNSLSFAAELAKAAGNSAALPETAAKSGGGLPAGIRQRISELTERIGQRLAAAGLKLAQPVELISDGFGHIAVGGQHPQQAAIEQVLGDDVLLEHDFHRLAGDYAESLTKNGVAAQPQTLTLTLPVVS